MRHSHWQVLDLDSTTATVRDVRKSYARRLKLCRPDHDPEGFQILHSAYTSALNELEWRGSARSSEIPYSQQAETTTGRQQTPLHSSDIDPLLTATPSTEYSQGRIAMTKVFDRLSVSLRTPGDELAPLLRDIESSLYLHPVEVRYWGQYVSRLIQQNAARRDLHFKSEVFLFELENDENAATLSQIEQLDRQANHESIRGFAYLFSSNEKRISTPSGGEAAYRLACAAAMWEPSFVKQLADFAYKYLPLALRNSYMNQLDSTRLRASSYAHIPDFCKWFWLDRIRNPQQPHSWDSSESQNAIRILKSRDARFWPCFLELVRLLPRSHADEIMASHKLPTLASDPNPELTLHKKNNVLLSGPAWVDFLPERIGTNSVFLWFVSIIAKPFELIAEARRNLRMNVTFWLISFFVIKALVLSPHCSSK